MSINAQMIVNVTARAVRAGSAGLEFNGLLLTKNVKALPFQRFESAESVASVYGINSTEYKFAMSYWAADEMKTKAPRALLIARDYESATAGWIKSGKITDLAALKEISAGKFTITVGGSSKNVTSLNLSSVSTLSQAATTIASSITGVTGTYDSVEECFYFTTQTTGKTQTMSFATGTDADKLGLTAAAGAVLNQGSDTKTPAQIMGDICMETQNWVTFTHAEEVDATRAIEFAKWTSKDLAYIYFPFTTSAAALTVGKTDLASKLAEAGVSYTCPIYGDCQYAAFFMGMVASTDYTIRNGVKNYAFKRSALLPANVGSTALAEIAKSKGYNIIGNFATRSAQFQISAWATTLGQTFKYLDEVAGMIWLANDVQRVCMDGITSVNGVSYSPRGYAMVRLWIQDSIDRGLLNGFITTGVVLSGAQKSQLIEAIGDDVSQEIEATGYHLVVADPGADVRAQRGSPIVQLYFTYGGQVLKIEPSVTAEL